MQSVRYISINREKQSPELSLMSKGDEKLIRPELIKSREDFPNQSIYHWVKSL